MLHLVWVTAFAFSGHWNLISENSFGSTEYKSWSQTIPRGACGINILKYDCIIFSSHYNMKTSAGSRHQPCFVFPGPWVDLENMNSKIS